MTAQDLYDYYGSWTEISRKLDLGISSPHNWRRIGYIPYKTQLLIEKKTEGRFKAELKNDRAEQFAQQS